VAAGRRRPDNRAAELRRYLDDKVWLENGRIMQIQRDIEHNAPAVRAAPPADGFAEIDDMAPRINLFADRPLFSPPLNPEIDDRTDVASGDDVACAVATSGTAAIGRRRPPGVCLQPGERWIPCTMSLHRARPRRG
jgi:uncharacterized protein DUF3375